MNVHDFFFSWNRNNFIHTAYWKLDTVKMHDFKFSKLWLKMWNRTCFHLKYFDSFFNLVKRWNYWQELTLNIEFLKMFLAFVYISKSILQTLLFKKQSQKQLWFGLRFFFAFLNDYCPLFCINCVLFWGHS